MPSAAWPATAASNALPPACRIWRPASVACGFMEEMAAWVPRITGRMVWPGSSLWHKESDASNRTISAIEAPITRCTLRAIIIEDLYSKYQYVAGSQSSAVPAAVRRASSPTAPRARRPRDSRQVAGATRQLTMITRCRRDVKFSSIVDGECVRLRAPAKKRRRPEAMIPSVRGAENENRNSRRKSPAMPPAGFVRR